MRDNTSREKLEPYIGPRPFKRSTDEQLKFFGQEEEVEQIISLILSKQLMLIYAAAGAGKTSMFNAKISPELENYGLEVLPLTCVGAVHYTRTTSSDSTIFSHYPVNLYMHNAFQNLKPKIDPQLFTNKSLYEFLNEYFSNERERDGNLKPQVLIFDQLEELFLFRKE